MCNQRLEQWQRRSLASLGQYENGFAFNDLHWSEHGLPIIRIAQITGSQDIVDRYPGILPSSYRLDDGDIIFSWSGTLAVVKWSGGPAWLNQHLFKVDPSPDIVPSFLYHVLRASIAEMDKRTHGSTMKHIKRGELHDFVVNVPVAKMEQKKIAVVLDTLDTAICETEAIVGKLTAVKQGLLHDLLTRGIDANGELRPPQSEAPHLYQPSPLGWIPVGWRVQTLEEITSTPICYGIVQVLGYVPDGVPVLAIRDLEGDYITGINRTAKRIDAAYPRSRARPGDVLLSIKGTIGRVGVVPDHFYGNISRDIALIRPREAILPGYLAQLLRSPLGQNIISQAQVGTTRAEISIAPLRKISVPLPNVEEQERIEIRLRSADERLQEEKSTFSKLAAEKSGLMNDLLTGRVRVTPLLEQAGESLLSGGE